MSTMQYVQVLISPQGAAAPRGARLGTRMGQGLVHFGKVTWRTLEAFGQRRADRELARMAWSFESRDPALARRLRRGISVETTD